MEQKTPKTSNKCFIRGCSSSSKSKGVSTFSFPTDQSVLQQWLNALPNYDTPPDETSVICEQHFDPKFLQRNYSMLINGKLISVPRLNVFLKKDAIPTIFPVVPSVVTKQEIKQERIDIDSMQEMEIKTPKRTYKCIIPGCSTTIHSKGISRFSFPKDGILLQKWLDVMPTCDEPPDKSSVICDHHFDPKFIHRNYSTIINGKEVLIPRGKPLLDKNAIPTIFPKVETPKCGIYVKRKKLDDFKVSKKKLDDFKVSKKKLDDFKVSKKKDVLLEKKEKEEKNLLDVISDIVLPDFWVRLTYPQSKQTISFITLNAYSHHTDVPDKKIVVQFINEEALIQVYFKGIKTESAIVTTNAELQAVVNRSHRSSICSGAGKVTEFQDEKKNSKNLKSDGETLRDSECVGKVDTNEKTCLQCKVKRRNLLRSRSNKELKKQSVKIKTRRNILEAKNKAIKRLTIKSTKMSNVIAEMKSKMKQERRSNIVDALSELPHKQKLAIQECIKASKRKNIKGMKYDDEWILESMKMQMKSPKLYEYLRVNKILALPGRTSLKKASEFSLMSVKY